MKVFLVLLRVFIAVITLEQPCHQFNAQAMIPAETKPRNFWTRVCVQMITSCHAKS